MFFVQDVLYELHIYVDSPSVNLYWNISIDEQNENIASFWKFYSKQYLCFKLYR